MADTAAQLRRQILDLTAQYCSEFSHPGDFIPGVSPVPVSGKVIDGADISAVVDSALDGWFTTGRFAETFERNLARFVGVRSASLVNSGSSANLVALSALTSPKLGDRRLSPGDEVITVAAGFPTTVNPIFQNRLVPVFVDVTVPEYEIDVRQLEAARSDRTKAVFVAHTLGNVFDLDAVTAFTRKHNLWLIEDCCDALGSTYKGRNVGTFGDIATLSFYPAHHITTGEGGAVLTDKPALQMLIESFRDWGRDCWCEPGKDNTCGKRFEWQLGSLPCGYDHKYIYSHIGYNLKATDMQAALGASQLTKLPEFIARRKANFHHLRTALAGLEDYLILPEATAAFRSVMVWLPHWSARGCAISARGSDSRAGCEQNRYAPSLRRQSPPTACLSGLRVSRGRRAPQHRLCDEQCVLGWRIPGTDAADARLRGCDNHGIYRAVQGSTRRDTADTRPPWLREKSC